MRYFVDYCIKSKQIKLTENEFKIFTKNECLNSLISEREQSAGLLHQDANEMSNVSDSERLLAWQVQNGHVRGDRKQHVRLAFHNM